MSTGLLFYTESAWHRHAVQKHNFIPQSECDLFMQNNFLLSTLANLLSGKLVVQNGGKLLHFWFSPSK